MYETTTNDFDFGPWRAAQHSRGSTPTTSPTTQEKAWPKLNFRRLFFTGGNSFSPEKLPPVSLQKKNVVLHTLLL